MRHFILISYLSILFCQSSPSIALVLSGGGANGIAHIPTLEIIDSLNINHRFNDPGVFCLDAFGTHCPIYD